VKNLARWIFLGSNGIRAGWRIAIFLGINATIAGAIFAGLHFAHVKVPFPKHVMYPSVVLGEGAMLAIAFFAAFIMSKIERRPFAAYGLPRTNTALGRVVAGFFFGFAMISAVLLCLFALHGFRITGIATHGIDLLAAALIWTAMFLLVGLNEEFTSRGYEQFTLATGIGFWPAAVVLSALFGLLHLHNAGESPIGIAQASAFGLFMCLVLRQTGNLWLCVGIHAGWDWGESFFYGVPDSGLMTWHSFLSSSFAGPVWLTGGSAGPEGSILGLAVLLVAAGVVVWRYPPFDYAPTALRSG
jgi:uncharacterized protein